MNREDYAKLSNEELIERIDTARQEKNAIILAHNYQTLNIQHIADFMGDSLELARKAAQTDADMVVFCGVDFMAESAKILSPQKTVLLPDLDASCPMAHMADAVSLAEMKRTHPDAAVVSYVNSTAEVKALTDVCCTSSNSIRVVKSLGGREIVFLPDRNLAAYTQKETGADIIPWDGYCFVHNTFNIHDVKRAREAHPDAVLIVHPECPPEVIELADKVFSTSGMAKYVEGITDPEEKKRGVIIGTEIGLVDQLIERYPDVKIRPLHEMAVCGAMKQITLDKVCWSIETENYKIELPIDVIEKARASLERMLSI